jgi:hypothetical protein
MGSMENGERLLKYLRLANISRVSRILFERRIGVLSFSSVSVLLQVTNRSLSWNSPAEPFNRPSPESGTRSIEGSSTAAQKKAHKVQIVQIRFDLGKQRGLFDHQLLIIRRRVSLSMSKKTSP